MRISGGTHRGRILSAPKTTGTRPMTDKVREAVFNTLGDIEDLSVLDAYAGSGALGFEALSRGAARVTAIESAKLALQTIGMNRRVLDSEWEYMLLPMTVESYLARQPDERFDIIFAMPPYAALDKRVLARMADHMGADGLMIVEYPRQEMDYEIKRFEVVKVKPYGDPTLVYYKLAHD